jgi:hydrogen peroxide-dependent heme synthase
MSPELYPVPLSVEGYCVLHQMMRFRWAEWRKLDAVARKQIASEAAGYFGQAESKTQGQSAVFSMVGEKGDLLLIHFRQSIEQLKQVELQIQSLKLGDYFEPASSFLSVVELGLYESSVKLFRSLAEKGIEPHSEQWKKEIEELLTRQREAMKVRLLPEMPDARYVCFYPMDRKRGEDKNWYMLSIEERQRQMDEHGKNGRRFAGTVKQVISAGVGLDDWEWGVDLFANDALAFKKIVYEMRFDEVSAVYGLFGKFYVGVRVKAEHLPELLDGKLPGNADPSVASSARSQG